MISRRQALAAVVSLALPPANSPSIRRQERDGGFGLRCCSWADWCELAHDMAALELHARPAGPVDPYPRAIAWNPRVVLVYQLQLSLPVIPTATMRLLLPADRLLGTGRCWQSPFMVHTEFYVATRDEATQALVVVHGGHEHVVNAVAARETQANQTVLRSRGPHPC